MDCKHSNGFGWCDLIEDSCFHFEREDYVECGSFEEELTDDPDKERDIKEDL